MLKVLPALLFTCSLSLTGFAQEEERNFRIFPHVADPEGAFQTFVIFENTTDEFQTVHLVPYFADGTQRPIPSETLDPREIRTLPQEHILGETAESHFFVGGKFEPSLGIRTTIAYALRNGEGSPVYISEFDTAATRWRFFAGDGARVFDSFAMVNLGTGTTSITIRQLDADGEVIQEVVLNEPLPRLARKLLVLGADETASFDRSLSNIFEIEATMPIVAIGLKGIYLILATFGAMYFIPSTHNSLGWTI